MQTRNAVAVGATVARDDDAGTVICTHPDGREMFRAIRKGGPDAPWIVCYSTAFYAKPDSPAADAAPGAPVTPAKPAQVIAGHSVRVMVSGGGKATRPGQRYARIDGAQIVPVEICGLAAGRDAWMRQIRVICLDCRQTEEIGRMTCELCPTCTDKAEQENAEQDGNA